MGDTLLARLDARDRVLFTRLTLTGRSSSPVARWTWVAVTHCGGLTASIAGVLIPLLVHGAVREAALRALVGLVISHLIVQVVKRRIARQRPSRVVACETLVAEPPCFSFPSGHSTASMAVAFAYAAAFPLLAVPLMLLAVAVGLSRVRLGVHFPGDVLAGQLIAVLTDLAVLAWW
jgi:undecaprenyl-diphosphatase